MGVHLVTVRTPSDATVVSTAPAMPETLSPTTLRSSARQSTGRMRDVTPREWRYWPDEDGPLGLLLCEDAEGNRLTVVVEGGWLRLLELDARVLEAGLDMPDEARFPVEASGWPDDWDARTRGLLDTVVGDLRQGVPWADIVAAVERAYSQRR